MPALKHTHSYIKLKNREGFWKCANPACTHIRHEDFIKGKESACPDCGELLVLDGEMIRRARPLCVNCRDTKEARQFRATRKLVEDTFPKGDDFL